jgi:hypothetical protein
VSAAPQRRPERVRSAVRSQRSSKTAYGGYVAIWTYRARRNATTSG